MTLIVQKFGGTSIANVDRIKSVANLVRDEVEKGHQVIVVLSAMAGVTNQLVGWAHQSIHHHLDPAEYDVVVSSGEQVTCGLMALALNDMGLDARSWLAWQIGIHTTDQYKNAHIEKIDVAPIQAALKKGQVAVVSGFQGVCAHNRLTTLGRGGSDYTAVALAAEFKADRCDIYTDVDGIYTADPRAVTNARLIKAITYQDALNLALEGARVLQAQAIEKAAEVKMPLRVLSSFHNHDGTLLQEKVETQHKYLGVASRRDRSLITIKLSDKGASLIQALRAHLEQGFVDLDYATDFKILHNEVKILVSRDDLETTEQLINQFSQQQKDTILSVSTQSRIAKVALIGKFGDNQVDLVEQIKVVLEGKDYHISHSAFNDHAICFLTAADQMEDVVKYLHETYILSKSNIKEVA